MSKKKSFVFGALGALFTLITTAVAFVLFLGSISGPGSDTLLTASAASWLGSSCSMLGAAVGLGT